jgi:hypothetical protein
MQTTDARLLADAFLHAHADEMLNGSYGAVIESAVIHVMHHANMSRDTARRAVAHATGDMEARTNKAYVDMSASTSYSLCLVVDGHRVFITAGSIANCML